MRERLIELLSDAEREHLNYEMANKFCPFDEYKCHSEYIADYLIENGVVVLPCKVGDVVYRIYTRAWIGEDVVREVVVSENGVFYIDDKGRMTSCNKFGKTVFLNREDAEAKLKGETK